MKPPKPAREYQISQVTEIPRASTGLDLINLQIEEFTNGKTQFLFDTGAAVTLEKLRNLKGDTLIYNKLIEIGDSTLKLYPYKIIRINPRCEAIIEVISTTNNTGVVQAEET
ncbi:hypothetical protein ALC57_05603 [Trachymyrmex cornetzi]|uniref:Uncharacterized protein n=1 Tax=Trachymyrmex cornetzi TaxID=471704 RepID=A0A151JAA8_9HYME|nr:hypothetical protein ALC57_05603 [Trachymyrmex cornetzi]